MWKEPTTWEEFEEGKRYKFSKQTYLNSYLTNPDVTLGQACELYEQQWVGILDGKEVVIDTTSEELAEALGYKPKTIARYEWFVIPKMWCEEITED